MDRTVPFSLDVLADAREQLQQLSQLSPCDSHFVASVSLRFVMCIFPITSSYCVEVRQSH